MTALQISPSIIAWLAFIPSALKPHQRRTPQRWITAIRNIYSPCMPAVFQNVGSAAKPGVHKVHGASLGIVYSLRSNPFSILTHAECIAVCWMYNVTTCNNLALTLSSSRNIMTSPSLPEPGTLIKKEQCKSMSIQIEPIIRSAWTHVVRGKHEHGPLERLEIAKRSSTSRTSTLESFQSSKGFYFFLKKMWII